jgi:hypothetical protein
VSDAVTVTPSWDPNTATYRDTEGRVVQPPVWEGIPSPGVNASVPVPPPQPPPPPVAQAVPTAPPPAAAQPPGASGDGWMYVDPSSYSDPYTPTPVYSSGPQPEPTAVPPAGTPFGPTNGVPGPSMAGTTTAPTDWTGPTPTPVGWTPVAESAPGYNGATGVPQAAAPSGVSPPGAAYNPQTYNPQTYNGQPTPGPVSTAPPPSTVDAGVPEVGDLKIKERRSWKTWQLVAAILVAAVVGMAINGNSGTASGSGSSANGGTGYKLPPPGGAAAGGSSPTTTAAGATTTTAAGATTTTAAGGSNSTTATSAPVAVGPATVLVPQTTQTGNWTSPAFTIAGGTWNIGWAFQCAPAPSGGPAFQIFVVNNGAGPGSTPAVTSSDASGNSITAQTSTGSQQLILQTTAACRWAVKVTGSSS